MASPYPT